tara:strand:- start:2032 stop:2334 length:303 start_codon:yes stop_codon:yes gene_type:complete
MGGRGNAGSRRAKIASDAVGGLAGIWLSDPSSEVAKAAGSAMLRTARRNRIRIPGELRMRSCRSCRKMLDSSNSRTRVRSGRIVVTCDECGRVHRYLGGD